MANCDFYGICDKISTEATRNFHNAVGIVLTDISNRTPDPYNPHIPGLRYDDSSCHNPIIYDDPSRMQSAFRNFFQWAESEAHSNAAQYSAYNISGNPIHHAHHSSVWRTALYEMEHNTPLGHDVLRDLANDDYVPGIQRPKVFYSFLARTWRDADDEFQNVFYAIAALRTLALAVRWGQRYSFWYKMRLPSRFGEVGEVNILGTEPIEFPRFNSYIDIPLWKIPFHYDHDYIFIDAEFPDDSKENRSAWTFNLYGKYKDAFLSSGIIHAE